VAGLGLLISDRDFSGGRVRRSGQSRHR
jgi:hypothetical protein